MKASHGSSNGGYNFKLFSVACKDNAWVAVGEKGIILVSTDNGETWTKKDSGTDVFIRSVACNKNTWVAAGDYGTILRSTDTAIWN